MYFRFMPSLYQSDIALLPYLHFCDIVHMTSIYITIQQYEITIITLNKLCLLKKLGEERIANIHLQNLLH